MGFVKDIEKGVNFVDALELRLDFMDLAEDRIGQSYFGGDATGLVFFDKNGKTILKYCHEDWDDPGYSGDYEIDPIAEIDLGTITVSIGNLVEDISEISCGKYLNSFKWKWNVNWKEPEKEKPKNKYWLPKTSTPPMVAC